MKDLPEGGVAVTEVVLPYRFEVVLAIGPEAVPLLVFGIVTDQVVALRPARLNI